MRSKEELLADKKRIEEELRQIRWEEYCANLPPKPAEVSSIKDVLGVVIHVGDTCAMAASGHRGVCYGNVSRLSEARVSLECQVHKKKCVGMHYKVVKV
jgi:hypothetical protein